MMLWSILVADGDLTGHHTRLQSVQNLDPCSRSTPDLWSSGSPLFAQLCLSENHRGTCVALFAGSFLIMSCDPLNHVQSVSFSTDGLVLDSCLARVQIHERKRHRGFRLSLCIQSGVVRSMLGTVGVLTAMERSVCAGQ